MVAVVARVVWSFDSSATSSAWLLLLLSHCEPEHWWLLCFVVMIIGSSSNAACNVKNWYFMISDDDNGIVVFVMVSLLSRFVDPVLCHHSSMMCWCVGGTEKIIVHSQTPSIMNYCPENDILRLNSLPRCFWSRIAISNILTITIVNIMLGNQVGLGA